MNITKRTLINNWISILFIMLFSFIIVSIAIVFSGKVLTEDTLESFYDYNIEEKKLDLKIEVDNRLGEIEYERNNIVQDEKLILRDKIQNVYTKLLNSDCYQSGSVELSALIQAYEEIVSSDDYLYFAINTKGELVRSGTDNQLEGINMMDIQDEDGTYFIRELLKAVDYSEGVYVEYSWPKEKNGQPLKKVSYAKYLPEFDIVIGTGSYYDDITRVLRNRIFDRLQAYYENKENYIFVHDYDSTAYVTGRRDLLGTKFNKLTDYNGKLIHDSIMEIIDKEGRGYLQYKFIDKDSDVPSEKISYIHAIEEWEVYIGMGFYIDNLHRELNGFNNNYKSYFYNQALFIVVGLILLALIVFALIQRGVFMQKKYLEQEDIIFEKLLEYAGQAVVILSMNGKVIYENELTKQLFERNIESYIDHNELALTEVEEGIYNITSNNKSLFIKYKRERMTFQGLDSVILFIENVTTDYLQTHRLETMAFLDTLTNIPNRRALEEDYKIAQMSSNNNMVIGILDIDHFKDVNDTYGHKVGDEVLILLGEIFKKRLRQTDQIYRFGGEEFVVTLDNVTLTIAKKIIIEINETFSREVEAKFGFKKTFSCGLVKMFEGQNQSLDTYIHTADQLLYKAKQNGRNRIEIIK